MLLPVFDCPNDYVSSAVGGNWRTGDQSVAFGVAAVLSAIGFVYRPAVGYGFFHLGGSQWLLLPARALRDFLAVEQAELPVLRNPRQALVQAGA